jgi:hypothetical protein
MDHGGGDFQDQDSTTEKDRKELAYTGQNSLFNANGFMSLVLEYRHRSVLLYLYVLVCDSRTEYTDIR